MRRILVTGAKGFIDSHLIPHLRDRGYEVYGDRELIPEFALNYEFSASTLVSRTEPGAVFHLAAQSSPVRSWQIPIETFEANVLGTIRLFEALRKSKVNPRIVLASSSAVYGGGEKLTEDSQLLPASPYAASKASMEMATRSYIRSYGMDMVIARIFGTTGPGKVGDVMSDIAVQVAKGKRRIRLGNSEARRDISDVRDVIKGLLLIMEKGKSGEVYNICRGQAYRIRDLVYMLGLEVEEDPRLYRAFDEPVICGDNSRIRELGYEISFPVERTLRDMIEQGRISP